MIVIGLTGTLGAGKGTVAEYLVRKKGFAHYSVRDFLVEEIKKRGMEINRDSMVIVGNDLRERFGPGYAVLELYKRALALGKNAIIESVRTIGEVEALRKLPNFQLWAVDADQRTRYERTKLRGSVTDDISFEKFVADEKREMESLDPAKQNLLECIKRADYVFKNDGTVGELEKLTEEILEKIKAKL